MANNFDSNFTRKLMMAVAEPFEAKRTLSKAVNTQTFQGQFNPNTGDSVDIKRPTDHTAVRTPLGDVTGQNSDIITGKATATVQDYITVRMSYSEANEALKMGTDKSRFFDDAARRIVTEFETDFAAFMMKNTGLLSGTVGTAVDAWSDVAKAGALAKKTGWADGDWYYGLDPFSEVALADNQTSLGVNPEVGDAFQNAMIRRQFAGFDVISSTTLQNYSTGTGGDRVGALAANPIVTYAAAKDSMTQVLSISGLAANMEIKAGEQVQITGRYRLDLATRQVIINNGNKVEFTGTVVEDATADGAGAVTLTITGPAIYEATGAYNTVDSAPIATDVVTILGADDATYQPNLFWHRNAFAIASVPMEKLHSTDTLLKTTDGLQLRVSKYADGDANQNIVRIDLRPAYGVINPFMAGQSFGF